VALTYNAGNKTWSNVAEKTDYDTGRVTGTTLYPIKGIVGQTRATLGTLEIVNYTTDPNWKGVGDVPGKLYLGPKVYTKEGFRIDQNSSQELKNYAEGSGDWAANAQANADSAALNEQNSKKNNFYNNVNNIIAGTNNNQYTYLQAKDAIARAASDAGVPAEELNKMVSPQNGNFRTFYANEKVPTWDTALGAKPLYGTFDAKYYKEQRPDAANAWRNAVNQDDLDVIQRYDENAFYLQDYSTTGKAQGIRGNRAEITQASNAYLETPPTDRDLQTVRDLQLGIDTGTQSDRLLNIPEIAQQWEAAKNGDAYWDKLAKEKYLDVSKKDEFAALFRLSDRPEDKQIALNYNVNAGYGITDLEDALNEAVGEKAIVDVKKFGALAQNVLKDTIKELQKVKSKEQALSLFRNFEGFSEITDINKTLSNSILGDSGVGGVLSFTSGKNPEDSLTKSLQGITGIQNNTTYNWQQWFDKTLKEKYNKDIELGYTAGEAKEQVKIEGDFARNFIDTYLTPRFNTARSMNEFVEYLDVRQEEQNPFQTQDLLNATTLTANLRSKAYLDQIKATSARSFDPNFYFSPTGDKARESDYAKQSSTVAADWEAAKKGDGYWAQQAYRFGVDVNDKAAFARMHFEVKGQGQGYDAAEDILNAGKVQDEIYTNILPALKDEALKQGTVFGLFETPEEFADTLLKGLNPEDTDNWNEVLKRYGLTDFKGTVEELKEYIAETLRTGSAQEIRSQIKYLNERRKKPTQENLGSTYIERPEDFKNEQASPDTELYKVFQSAGFQGSEDDFYTKFFPDVDRSEQQLLTKAGSNEALKLSGLNFSDPFASLGTIESFFAEDEPSGTTRNTSGDEDTDTNFFSLGSDKEDEDYKSATGQKILGEFTSIFKGL
jgi:hypothetical protein